MSVKVEESPTWIKRRLELCGLKPINNIVDVTNYVLLELGQPLHAFDFDSLKGQKIIVRKAKEGECIWMLDEVKRELDSDMLVIADEERPVALAGIMGGIDTAISPFTKNVFIESAHFNSANIRRTCKRLGLRTESSYRFERWVDPNGTLKSVNRTAQLMVELAGGRLCKGVIDVFPSRISPVQVSVRTKKVRELLGIDVTTEEIEKILQRLKFKTSVDEETIYCVIPSFRNDIKTEIDLIEEIARLHGYDKIPMTLPKGISVSAGESKRRKLENMVKTFLTRMGLREVITLSLTNPESEAEWGITSEAIMQDNAYLQLRNPLTQDHTIARTALLPNLLETVSHNFRNGVKDIWIFELGRIYRQGKIGSMESTEPRHLSIAITGNVYPVRWNLPTQTGQADLFVLKGIINQLMEWLGIFDIHFKHGKHPSLHPYRTAIVYAKGEEIGVLGELHPRWVQAHDFPQTVFVSELDFEKLNLQVRLERLHRPLPQFPSTQRDIAVVIPYEFESEKVIGVIKRIGGDLVQQVKVFDEYFGPPVPKGYRSIGFTITLQASDRTLSSAEADAIVQQIKKTLSTELNLSVRE